MLPRSPITTLCLSVVMEIQPSVHEEYVNMYDHDPDFCDIITMVKIEKPSEFILRDGLSTKDHNYVFQEKQIIYNGCEKLIHQR